eukprot:GABW01000071.1.p1 GENE.GABW01000071.1~~GABW01000071.1.p1  ORF type:complete len:100 (-),score=7.68 GABW01000071.1:3-302(-)
MPGSVQSHSFQRFDVDFSTFYGDRARVLVSRNTVNFVISPIRDDFVWCHGPAPPSIMSASGESVGNRAVLGSVRPGRRSHLAPSVPVSTSRPSVSSHST